MFNQIYHLVKSYKVYLPKKASRDKYPSILWIEPPLHKNFADNDRRLKFGACLSKTCKMFPGFTALQMRKIWSYDDANLFLKEQARFTVEGYTNYWLAVDCVVKLWDTFLQVKEERKDKKVVQQNPVTGGSWNRHRAKQAATICKEAAIHKK